MKMFSLGQKKINDKDQMRVFKRLSSLNAGLIETETKKEDQNFTKLDKCCQVFIPSF